MALEPNTRLGPYRVLSALGAGGMGLVYKAEDTRLGRPVALKLLPDAVSRNALAVERFLREARAAATLNHPNICTIYDVGEDSGRHYIAMELLEGQTLHERVLAGALPLQETIDLGVAIADALDAAHRAGVVHRDIKPANIFVTPRGDPKILDFGLAKLSGDAVHGGSVTTPDDTRPPLTASGTALGTVLYMSPEQARGEQVDARADLFSFGVVLHEMAAGLPAFPGNTNAVVFDGILNRPPIALDRIHPELRRIIAKAVEKNLALRYQSAADMRADLGRLKRDSGARASAGQPSRRARSRRGIESLAVLPLVNASANPDAEYLSDGISASLINSFSQFERLRVAHQQKSFRYRGDDIDLQHVARELNVKAILTGRILMHGDTLIVNVGLVDTEKDAQIWGRQFTKRMSDIFGLQDEIADEVMQSLRLKLTGEPKRRVIRHTRNTEAYHLYLKGRFYWAKRTPDNTSRALQYYQQAIERDPAYALAYAGVADCYAHLGFNPYGTIPPKHAYPLAKAAAQKAIALDSALGEAHASLGLCAFWYDWDWKGAEQAFRRSLELDPQSPGARVWYPSLLVAVNRFDEALVEAHRTSAADPLSFNSATALGQVLYFTRRYDEALGALETARNLDPQHPTVLAFIGLVRLAMGQPHVAVDLLERAATIYPHPHQLALKGFACGLANRHEDARAVLQQLSTIAEGAYVSPHSYAWVYLGLGEVESWKRMMDASVDERNGLLPLLRAPWNDTIRADPFLDELCRRVGLPATRS